MTFQTMIKTVAAGLLALTATLGCSINSSRAPDASLSSTGAESRTRGVGPGVKVAILLPLTGQGNAQQIAKALKQAGELALFDFDNPNVQIASKDTRGTPEGAQAAARDAIREGAELIIGPLFANEVAAVAPEAKRAGVPVIAFSSDQKVAGDGVYLLSFLAGGDVPRIVSYAASRGIKRYATLTPQTDYGRIVEQVFTRAVRESGGQIIASQQYPPDANGMLEPVKQIAALAKKGEPAQIDAIFMPAATDTLPFLAPLMPYYSVDTANVKLLGTSGWDFPSAGKEQSLLGAWYAAPDPKGWQDFTRRYVETYSDVPPRLASLAYDAVSLAVSLSGNPPGRRFSPQELTRASGFAGVDGLFRLRPDGGVERGLAVLEVQRYGAQIADPAPSAFSGAPAQY
ncbi:MAG: penicillin-binding protein activator [Hyphomicrobiales bacterium]|nr:penicillin-binding protein activator [Hyphomicrobiales bacterium]